MLFCILWLLSGIIGSIIVSRIMYNGWVFEEDIKLAEFFWMLCFFGLIAFGGIATFIASLTIIVLSKYSDIVVIKRTEESEYKNGNRRS